MDAPQFPDAEASAESAGGQPTGQASVFRRALDSQVETPEPSKALVPTSPLDVTAPMNLDVLRVLLASNKSGDAPSADAAATAPAADMSPVFPAPTEVSLPTAPVPAVPPSASGPTVVMPSVSAPALHAPTTIAQTADAWMPNQAAANTPEAKATAARTTATFAGVPVMPGPASPAEPSVAGGDNGGGGDGGRPEPGPSPRHNGKPSRLPTAVLISALLGACAGVALVLFNSGHSPDPLAPTAMPTKVAAPSPSPSPSHTAKPSPKPSPSPSPSHASPSPSHRPSPSPSAKPSQVPASPVPSTVASFATIYWTNYADPRVADIQSRLAKLNYLTLTQNNQYADSNRTTNGAWHQRADNIGYYQNATDTAIRAFEYDYIQHDQGQPPGPGCDTQTYQALVNATTT